MKKILGILILTAICCLNLTADLNEGLVAHYPFNGNANDESGNENDGTLHGDILLTSDRFGNENCAFYFDGVDDRIAIQNNIYSNGFPFTISCWFYLNDSTGTVMFPNCSYWSTGGQYNMYCALSSFSCSISSIGFSFGNGQGGGPHNRISYSADYDFQVNTWYNIILYCDNIDMENGKLYINTEEVIFSYSSGTASYVDFSGGSIDIGARKQNNYSYENYSEGKIDDIRIYNRALSEEEIEGIIYYGFNADFNSPEIAYIGEQIPFTDTSIGNPTIWEWDFENNGIYDSTYYSYQDTIYWTYENTNVDSVKLRISNGTLVDSLTKAISVLYCPPASPDSVQLTLNYPDVTISWTAVDTTICGSSITPDLYIIQYSETADDSLFYYLSSVFYPTTEFTHFRVLQYGNNGEPSDHMFYKVIAIKNYSREQIEYLESLNNSREKIKWSEVKQNLNRILK